MRQLRWICLAAALAGCEVVETRQPFGDEMPALEVSDWEGTWLIEEDTVVLTVEDEANARLSVTVNETTSRAAYLRRAGGDLFLNIRFEDDSSEPSDYTWLRVDTMGDKMLLWIPSYTKFERLVELGLLPGQIEKHRVILDALSPEHVALITSEREGVLFDWKTPIVLTRLGVGR